MNEVLPRKKVLYILPALDAGGAERVLITLMNATAISEYEPALLSVRRDGHLKSLIDRNIPFYSLDKEPSSFILPFLPALWRRLKALKPDIIISTMAHINFAILLLKPCLPNTVIIVREAITPSYFLDKYGYLFKLIRLLYHTLYSKADMIISPTQRVFDEFKSFTNLRDSHCYVLKNPVEPEKIRAAINLNAPTRGLDVVRFVACGRLARQKGFDRLITALADFNPSFDWQLDILGEGPEHSYLEALISDLGLEQKITLKGHIMPPYSAFAAADCFLLPSRFEGLPNVVLEALSCGTKVIATRTSGGIDEIAQDCGTDVVTVVDGMNAFIAEMALIKPMNKTKAAQACIASCYDQAKVVREFHQVLKGCIKNAQLD